MSGGFQINRPERMDVETFLRKTQGSVANLMSKELRDLDSAKVQTTIWIRFKVDVEDGDGNVIRVNAVDKAFNSWMMELFKGSNLNKIINNEMFAHMRMQFENLALDIDVDVEDGDGNIIRVNVVNKALNSWMMEVFKGSNLNEIINKMFAHMKMQIENLALVNS